MDKDTINQLRGLVYEYCLEKKTNYISGVTHYYNELNKLNFEKLSGFANWIEAKATDYGESEQVRANTKPSRKLAQTKGGHNINT